MDKIDVAGLKIDALTKQQFLDQLDNRIKQGQKTFITTPYSEFLYAALRDKEMMKLFNSADISIPDGIGVIWAQYFLSKPFSVSGYWGRVLQAWGQVVNTGAQILLNPKKLYQVFPEKLVGADMFWELSKWAADNNHSIYLIGWPEQECEKVKAVLEKKYPAINIVGYANVTPDDTSSLQDIKVKKPDLLMVAFGPIKQERWIVRNFDLLPVRVAVGLGGSFDYAIGKKIHPPRFIRAAGLEWLYRLFTQPTRVKRIYQAFWGLILSLVRYKVFGSMGYRRNGLAIVVNKENKILLCKRAYPPDRLGKHERWANNYWQFPQGGLKKKEDVIKGTARELEEETGMQNVEVLGKANFINHYDWYNNRTLFSKRRFRGQEQVTVFFRFLGSDDEIKLDQAELTDYEWLSPKEVLNKIAEERVPHAEAVLAELAELLRNK